VGDGANPRRSPQGKRQAEADADRGLIVDTENIKFGDYARHWITTSQSRTSGGFRESTRRGDKS
jgi:hypothetical protein